MDDLIRKLNLLLKSNVKGLVGSDRTSPDTGSPPRLGKRLDQDIGNLRQRIDDALAYETQLQNQVQSLADEIARLDAEADAAVEQGKEENARYLIADMQRAQQRLAIAEADLQEHRLVTQELIQHVNALEAAVAEAKQVESEREEDAAEEESSPGTATDVAERFSEALRDAGGRISKFAQQMASRTEQTSDEEPESVDDEAIDDDLSERRHRLSGKPK